MVILQNIQGMDNPLVGNVISITTFLPVLCESGFKKRGATITAVPPYPIHFLPISKNFHVFFDVFLQ